MHEVPQVLPPERPGLVRVWRWDVPVRAFKTTRVVGVGGLIVLAGWLFQNFLQLRGVVNLLLSRVDLLLIVLCLFAIACALTMGFRRKRLWRIVALCLLIFSALAVDWILPKSATDHASVNVHVFGVIVGGSWIAPAGFAHGLLWSPFAGTNKMTPIDFMQSYVITNNKSIPILITHLSVEMLQPHGWWALSNVPDGQPIWVGKLSEPKKVTQMIPKDGFLMENAGVELQPGRSIRGLMLCQFPTDYVPPEDHIHGGVLLPSLRLHIRDSANDEDIQSLDNLNQDVNVLRTGFDIEPVNADLSAYQIVPYGQ